MVYDSTKEEPSADELPSPLPQQTPGSQTCIEQVLLRPLKERRSPFSAQRQGGLFIVINKKQTNPVGPDLKT